MRTTQRALHFFQTCCCNQNRRCGHYIARCRSEPRPTQIVYANSSSLIAGHTTDQWVFLLDDSCLHLAPVSGGGYPGQPGGGFQPPEQQPEPWLLAVRIVGSGESVDLLDPQKDTCSLLHLKHLQLQGIDAPNAVWQAVATDMCSHSRVSPPAANAGGLAGRGGSVGPGADVHAWVQQNGWVCDMARTKAARLGVVAVQG